MVDVRIKRFLQKHCLWLWWSMRKVI